MSAIEKIKRYIERTHIKPSTKIRYQMCLDEMVALKTMAHENGIDPIILAFEFGEAKGYRAAKAEAQYGQVGG